MAGTKEHDAKLSSVNYDHFINDFSKLRESSAVRDINKLYWDMNAKVEKPISFAGGLPNPTTFPFKKLTVTLPDGAEIVLQDKLLQDSMQYILTQGYPPLLEKIRKLQVKVHNPPRWDDCNVVITPGCQDGLCKAVEMCLEPGEPIIVQHPLYSGMEAVLKPYKADIIAIEQDDNGLRPDLLREALQSRLTPQEAFTKQKGVPKLLYLNTTGANPTGVAITTERKREIYQIACEYNLIILEDDPYYYLHFQDEYPTSFLSMDTEGRVIRFDSFSKTMSAGMRVGFVTGHKTLLKYIELHVQVSSLHACSLSQVLIDVTMEHWGFKRLFDHFAFIQKFYKAKRDAMLLAVTKHLTGLAEWTVPTAGMFLWLKVLGLRDVRRLVTEECIKQGVMFVTGHAYMVKGSAPCPYLRACYTLPSSCEMEEGVRRLAGAIRLEQKRVKDLAEE